MRIPFVTENTVDVASDVNGSLLTADGLIVSRVTGIETAPPASPADGQRVAVASGATGAFAGKGGQLAIYVANGAFWQFYNPVVCIFDDKPYVSKSGGWVLQSSGGVATDDPRLSDAREWIEETVGQAEAEGGTSTTRRAWTAQRVRQAIAAWWGGVSSVTPTASKAVVSKSDGKIDTGWLDAVGNGKVMREDAGGWLGTGELFSTEPAFTGITTRVMRINTQHQGIPADAAVFHAQAPNSWFRLHANPNIGTGSVWIQAGNESNGLTWTAELYSTKNTTKNPDGTLKASSPVINLFTDRIELHNEKEFGATPHFTRLSKGVYELTGTLGLRSEGWYLDTPSDRNGNKYFNVEWTQNVTHEAIDGVVESYRDDVIVTVETFERVWNPATGLHENGEHVDINDTQDRFVQLRFNEIKQEEPEVL